MDVGVERSRARLGVAAAIVLIVAALVVTVILGIVRTSGSPVEQAPPATEMPIPAAVYVHVSGAVAQPGLYRLDTGARVVDVIAAAGGFTDDAEQSAVNLAREVTDGEQLSVPKEGEAPRGEQQAKGDRRIDLNTADQAALDTLPRIGPALAQRIIEWREQNGRFTSVEDLLAVPGIGDKMLEALRDLVVV